MVKSRLVSAKMIQLSLFSLLLLFGNIAQGQSLQASVQPGQGEEFIVLAVENMT